MSLASLIVLIMAGSIVYMVFVFAYYPKKMQEFCDSVAEGSAVTNIKSQAENKNFRVSDINKDGTLLVYDTKTMGKSTCFIDYTEAGRVVATAYMGDE